MVVSAKKKKMFGWQATLWWLEPTKEEADRWEAKTDTEKKWWLSLVNSSKWAADAQTDKIWAKPGDIWGKSEDWIYMRWERLVKLYPSVVLTSISPEQLAASIKTCTHPHSDRDLPESGLRWGTREYIKMCKRLGFHETGKEDSIEARQRSFLTGFDDPFGNHWCGLCYIRFQVMDMGANTGFVDMYTLYASPETYGVSDYEGWLSIAVHGSVVLLDCVARGAQHFLEGEKKNSQKKRLGQEESCQRST